MSRVFGSFVTRAIVLVLTVLTLCMIGLLVFSASLIASNKFADFETAIVAKTASVAGRVAPGTRLRRPAMIRPEVNKFLAAEGADLVEVRATHLSGEEVFAKVADDIDPDTLSALPPATFTEGAEIVRQTDTVTIFMPMTTGNGGAAVTVGEFVAVWNTSGVRSDIASAIFRLAIAFAMTVLVIWITCFVALRALVARPLGQVIEAMTRIAHDETDVTLPTGTSREMLDMRGCLVSFLGSIRTRNDLAEKGRREEAERLALLEERQEEAVRSREEGLARAAAEQEKTAQQNREAEELQTELRGLVQAVSSGDLACRMTVSDVPEHQVHLRGTINVMVERVDEVLETVSSVLRRLEDGDLRARVDGAYSGSFERLQSSANATAAKLDAALGTLGTHAMVVLDDSSDLTASAEDLSKRTERTAASLNETTIALEKIVTSIGDTATLTDAAKASAVSAREEAVQSDRIVSEAVASMEKIQSVSGEISKTLNVIDDIAFQTNLLALNAGVEAARAGEAGRGFAVVASEVRALAQKASNAADGIGKLMMTSTEHVENGVASVGRTGASLTKLGKSVESIGTQMEEIAVAADAQSSAVQEINSAMGAIDQSTQQNAAMFEEMTTANLSLTNAAQHMVRLIQEFEIADAELDRTTLEASLPQIEPFEEAVADSP